MVHSPWGPKELDTNSATDTHTRSFVEFADTILSSS